MDLKLQVKQSQVLSQRMIQSAEILQMTSQELNTYINDLALENPVIDMVEPASGSEQQESIEQQQWLNSFREETYYLYQRQNNDDDYDFKNSWNIDTDTGETLQDYLWSQLITEAFSEQEAGILKYMLECLDSKGYLSESTADIAVSTGAEESLILDLLEDLRDRLDGQQRQTDKQAQLHRPGRRGPHGVGLLVGGIGPQEKAPAAGQQAHHKGHQEDQVSDDVQDVLCHLG